MPSPLPATEILAAHLMPKRTILGPILCEENLGLLYGPRGIGKSFLALGIAWAAATGDRFLTWQASRPRRVLYIDGELTGIDLQQRLAALGPPPPALHFLSAGLQHRALPDLGYDEEFDMAWEPRLATGFPELLVIDSLSSVIGETLKGAERWDKARRWLLRMREIGMAVLVVHHAARGGAPRGPSHREDVFDLVMGLRPPSGYRPRDGLRFELHYEKTRGLHGAAVDPFEARMTTDRDGRAQWDCHAIGSAELHRVAALLERGLNPNQIARELGISKSKSYRLRERLVQAGM
jgi:hypothetical protein